MNTNPFSDHQITLPPDVFNRINNDRIISVPALKSCEQLRRSSAGEHLSTIYSGNPWRKYCEIDSETIENSQLLIAAGELVQLCVNARSDAKDCVAPPPNSFGQTNAFQSLSMYFRGESNSKTWVTHLLSNLSGLLDIWMGYGLLLDMDDYALLGQQNTLITLSMRDASTVDDASMPYIAQLKQLRRLDLSVGNWEIKHLTAGGYKHLSKLEQLTHLNLANRTVDDASLEQIGQLKNLRVLLLQGCPISNTGLKHLSHLKQLERLWLWSCDVDDDGFEHIAHLDSLQDLQVTGYKRPNHLISDRGIRHLAHKLPNLQRLKLTNHNVSLLALPLLRTLYNLEEFTIYND